MLSVELSSFHLFCILFPTTFSPAACFEYNVVPLLHMYKSQKSLPCYHTDIPHQYSPRAHIGNKRRWCASYADSGLCLKCLCKGIIDIEKWTINQINVREMNWKGQSLESMWNTAVFTCCLSSQQEVEHFNHTISVRELNVLKDNWSFESLTLIYMNANDG